MAYIPPHKRHSRDVERPTPVPTSPIPRFKDNVNLGSKSASKRRKDRQGQKIVYAKHAISRWWPVGSTDKDQIPASFRLEPISCERRTGDKPLVLMSGQVSSEASEGVEQSAKSPWAYITEKIQPDLFAALQNARNEMESATEDIRPIFVARFGKVFFNGGSSISLDAIRKIVDAESDSRNQVHKSFYTNVPQAYMEDIQHLIIPKIGMHFDSEKEYYHVKVSDNSKPDATISCKCTVTKDGRELEMLKIELNQVRHLVVDISCLYKDLDLRLMLCSKRILTDLDDKEKYAISELIRSAILDPEVKGGLRWPLGKESVGNRFSVVGVWHTKFKSFKGPETRLKLRHADRFDFRASTGEVSTEVSLKMKGISRGLREGMMESSPVIEMLQETVKLIWDHFLSCNHSLT